MPVAEGPGKSLLDVHGRQKSKQSKYPHCSCIIVSSSKTLLTDILQGWVEPLTQFSPSYRLKTCCSENWRDIIIHPMSAFEWWVTIWMDIHLVWMLNSQKFRLPEEGQRHRYFAEREGLTVSTKSSQNSCHISPWSNWTVFACRKNVRAGRSIMINYISGFQISCGNGNPSSNEILHKAFIARLVSLNGTCRSSQHLIANQRTATLAFCFTGKETMGYGVSGRW